MTQTFVHPGQQYCPVASGAVWQVLAVYRDPAGIPHARLANVARPHEVKTLTCSVLLDEQHYHLLSQSPERGAATNRLADKLRRRIVRMARRAA